MGIYGLKNVLQAISKHQNTINLDQSSSVQCLCCFAQVSLACTIFVVKRGFFLRRYAANPQSKSLLFTVRRFRMIPSSARQLEILLHVVLLSLSAIFFIFRSNLGEFFSFYHIFQLFHFLLRAFFPTSFLCN